ncbi:hypothetical protein BJX62DRAFT_241945 [Aspergillus germanicus]
MSSTTTNNKPTTCIHCKKTECAPRYMKLTYKYTEPVTLQLFADDFGKVVISSDLKINRCVVTGFKAHPLVRHVWLDIAEPPADHDLRLKLTVPAREPHRPVLPTVTSKNECVAALEEVKEEMENMNAEGGFAVVKEMAGSAPGVISFK